MQKDQAKILQAIVDADESLRAAEIVESTGLTITGVMVQLAELIGYDYVAESDNWYRITSAGREALTKGGYSQVYGTNSEIESKRF